MAIPQTLKLIAAAATALTGLVVIVAPWRVQGFTGLELDNPRGITEMRAGMGAFYLGMGIAPLLLASQARPMFLMLGLTYLMVAAVRLVSMALDRSANGSNIASLVIEVAFGVILIL